MGCGSNINEKEIIVKLLKNEITDFTFTKDNDICGWNLTINVNNIIPDLIKPTNSKSKTKFINPRPAFGYKSNNKVNNFNFKFHESNEGYIIQYRNENKAIRCLPQNSDLSSHSEKIYKSQKESLNNNTDETSISKQDSIEKSLIHQVRFWQHQNPETDKYRALPSELIDFQKQLSGQQINGSIHSTIAPSHGSRSSIQNKRNLDMIIPQGTAYDIISDDSRLSGNLDLDKWAVSNKNRTQSSDGMGFCNFSNAKMRNVLREGGTLEFAKLLDEKLRILYEQKYLSQPSWELNKSKSENKPKKSISREKSANVQVRNEYLNSLSINGRSAGRLSKPSIIQVPKTAENQYNIFMPCLLPQMPAFGIQHFPRFISCTTVFGSDSSSCSLSNSDYRTDKHEE